MKCTITCYGCGKKETIIADSYAQLVLKRKRKFKTIENHEYCEDCQKKSCNR